MSGEVIPDILIDIYPDEKAAEEIFNCLEFVREWSQVATKPVDPSQVNFVYFKLLGGYNTI